MLKERLDLITGSSEIDLSLVRGNICPEAGRSGEKYLAGNASRLDVKSSGKNFTVRTV